VRLLHALVQRGAVVDVALVGDEPQVRVGVGGPTEIVERGVGRPVVHHEDRETGVRGAHRVQATADVLGRAVVHDQRRHVVEGEHRSVSPPLRATARPRPTRSRPVTTNVRGRATREPPGTLGPGRGRSPQALTDDGRGVGPRAPRRRRVDIERAGSEQVTADPVPPRAASTPARSARTARPLGFPTTSTGTPGAQAGASSTPAAGPSDGRGRPLPAPRALLVWSDARPGAASDTRVAGVARAAPSPRLPRRSGCRLRGGDAFGVPASNVLTFGRWHAQDHGGWTSPGG
jgi:hypothetical protein